MGKAWSNCKKNVVKTYGKGKSKIYANNNISFEINKGELTIIVGPSGAGNLLF